MTDDEARLLALMRRCGARDRQALLTLAEFLAAGDEHPEPPDAVPAPAMRPEPRPAQETVVMAIRRLTRTYPMLDRRKLMGPTSMAMSQHALQGRPAAEVIDELETLFGRLCMDAGKDRKQDDGHDR